HRPSGRSPSPFLLNLRPPSYGREVSRAASTAGLCAVSAGTWLTACLPGAGDFLQPGLLVLVRLTQAGEQLPGFGFEQADECEVTFSVPVCHGLCPWLPPRMRGGMTRRLPTRQPVQPDRAWMPHSGDGADHLEDPLS